MEIADKELRWKSMHACAAYSEAADAYDNYCPEDGDKSLCERIDAIERAKRTAIDAIYVDAERQIDAIKDASPAWAEDRRLQSVRDAAETVCSEIGRDILWNVEGDPVLCALSGVPIWEDEEVLTDEATGEVIIRSLVLPPRRSDDSSVSAE